MALNCKVCGAKITEGSAVCELCGSPIGSSRATNNSNPFVGNNNAYHGFNEQYGERHNLSQESTKDNNKRYSNDNNAGIRIDPKILVIIAAAILVISIFLILLLKAGNEKPVAEYNNSNNSSTAIEEKSYSNDDYSSKTIKPEMDENIRNIPANDKQVYYRVRKSAGDAESQIGAFNSFDNAKRLAESRKNEGYKVYDMDGNLLYVP